MTTFSDLRSTMVNLRRVAVSFILGLVFLGSVTLQAGAAQTDASDLATTQRGLALGLAAGAELAQQVEEGVVVGEGVARSLEVLESVVERFNEKNSKGNGPLRAVEVHEALLRGELPSSIDGVGAAGNAYGLLRQQLQGEGRGTGNGFERGNRPPTPPGQNKKDN